MSARRRRLAETAAGLAVGGVALALALRGVDLADVGRALDRARASWLAPVAFAFLAQQALRAWRQALLVRAVAPAHRYRTSLSVLCIGFLLINTLPARLGELARPLLLAERDRVPLGAGVAVVVLERAIDLASMFALLALAAWLAPAGGRPLLLGGVELDWLSVGRAAAAVALPAAALGVLGAVLLGRPLARLLDRAARRPGRAGRLLRPAARHAAAFGDAAAGLRSPGRLAAVLGLTAASWAVTAWTYPLLARAFGIAHLVDLREGVGLLGLTMLGMALPAPPGFAGTYEAFVRAGLALYGVRGPAPAPGAPPLDAVAVAYALTMHWWIFAVQAATALFFLAVDRVDPRRLLREIARQLAADDAPGLSPAGGAGGRGPAPPAP